MNRACLTLTLLALAGCTTIDGARVDNTHLSGDVPTGLGRTVAIQLDGADEESAAALLSALEREFVTNDLFDTVLTADSGATDATRLRVNFLRASDEDLYDLLELQGAHAVRYELEIELRNAAGEMVLDGRVDGIGVDDVTDNEFLDTDKREDIKLSALHDAAMKVSRGLRQAANQRATKALLALPEIGLPAGVAPLEIAVLGFDDVSGATRRRGGIVTERLTEAIFRLGREFSVTPYSKTQRAVDQEDPTSFHGLKNYEIALIARHVPARLYVVGKVKMSGGDVSAEARVLDREGNLILTESASTNGLGALPVVAVELAEKIGVALQTAPLPEKGAK